MSATAREAPEAIALHTVPPAALAEFVEDPQDVKVNDADLPQETNTAQPITKAGLASLLALHLSRCTRLRIVGSDAEASAAHGTQGHASSPSISFSSSSFPTLSYVRQFQSKPPFDILFTSFRHPYMASSPLQSRSPLQAGLVGWWIAHLACAWFASSH